MRTLLKVAGGTALALVCAVVLALAGLYAFAQTDAGQARLAALAGRMLSQPGQEVRIGRVAPSWLLDRVRIRDLALADADGTWLTVEQATVDWRPAGLLRARIEAERVAVDEAVVLRAPRPAEDDTEEPGGGLPLDIDVESLTIEPLRLDPAVVGEAAALSVAGAVHLAQSGRIEADLAAEPSGDARGRYDVDVRWAPDGGRLALDLKVEEGVGGLLAGLAGVPEAAPLSLAVTGEGPLDDWRGELRATLADAGTVESELRVAGRDPVVVTVQGRADYPAPEDPLLRRLVASAAAFDGEAALAAGEVVELRRLRIEAGRVVGEASGRFDAARTTGAAEIRLTAEQGQELSGAAAARVRYEAGAVTAELRELRLDAPELQAALRTPATLRYGDGAASLAGLDLTVAGARVTGAAEYAPEGLTADLEVAALSLAVLRRFMPDLGVAGEVDATLHAEGTLAAPTARADLTVRGLRPVDPALGDVPPLAGKISGRLDGGAVALDGRLAAPEGAELRLSAEGPVAFSAAPFAFALPDGASYTADAELRGLALSQLRAVLPGLPLEGRVGGTVHLSGPLARPAGRITLDGSGLRATAPTLADLPALAGTIKGELAEGRLTLGGELAAPEGPSLRLDLAAPLNFAAVPFALSVPQGEALSATLAARNLDVAQLRAAAPGLALAGRAEGEVRLEGSLAAPAGQFQLSVADLRAEVPGEVAPPLISGTVSGELADGRLSATGSLSGPDGAALDLELGVPVAFSLAPAELAVRQDAAISGNLELRALSMRTLTAVAPAYATDGRLDAALRLSGTAARPEGELQVTADGLRLEEGPPGIPPARLEAQGTLSGGALAISGAVTGLSETDVTLEARLPVEVALAPPAARLARDGPISGRLDWTGAIGPIVERLPLGPQRLEGRADIAATLGGTVSAPEISGRLGLADGRYEHLVAGTLLQQLDLAADFDGRRLVIRRAAATDGGDGRIAARGAVAFGPGFQPDADITIEFDNATVIRRDELVATVGGALTLAGGPADGLLTGRLETRRVEARLIANLPPSVVDLPVEEANAAAPASAGDGGGDGEEEGGVPALRLDVSVNMPNSVFLRGRGLESEWAGELQVGGTAEEPRIEGALRPLRGDFDAFGRTFVLGEGEVQFTGGDTIDPQLDLRAVQEQDGFKAIVHVGGTAQRPTFELQSEPPMPRDEIVARMLFGKDPGQLSPFEALQVADTAATISGRGSAGGILDRARRFIGVDTLRVEGGEGGSGDVGVSVGKRISEDVYVDVSQGRKPGSSKATVEVELTPNLQVESDIRSNSGVGAGIKWKWDY